MIVQATEQIAPEPAAPLRLVTTPTAARRAEVLALYEAHFRSTARLAYLLCGNTQQADDLTHDAFVRLWEHWDKVDDPTRRVAYLRSIVVNLANSAHRRAATARRHASAPALALVGDSTSAEDEAMHRAARPDVMAALAALPDRQRSAIVLRHWLRMTEGEIAEAMGCSVGSVRTHVARAYKALAIRLGGLR
jgi:RNA polymerase sigma-70 factor (ECF subfamily)